MPRDINGVYTLPLPDVTLGTVTSTAWANTTLSDIALALTNSLSINGSVTPAKLNNDQAGFQAKFGVDAALATAEARLTFLESCAASQIGDIEPFAMGTVPAKYLECTGAAVSRATYADLFSVVGTMFGVGDGSTTFNLPEMRGESMKGAAVADTPGTMQAGQVGAHAHTATAANSATHTHTATTSSDGAHGHTATAANSASHTHTVSGGATGNQSSNHTHSWSATTATAGAHTHTISRGVTTFRGSGNNGFVPGSGTTVPVDTEGNHTHTASGTTSAAAAHDHAVAGTTGGGGAHNHDVTLVNSVAHTHTFTTSSDGGHSHTVTVASAGGEGQVRNVAVMYCIRFEDV